MKSSVTMMTFLGISFYPNYAISADVTVIVRTEILEKPLAFQVGVKSVQAALIEYSTKKVENTFSTGKTNFIVEWESVRNNFQITGKEFSDDGEIASFNMSGETASGIAYVGPLPNINYKFNFVVKKSGKVVLRGCHDGYPSYFVEINGVTIYWHDQQHIGALLGSCDIELNKVEKSF